MDKEQICLLTEMFTQVSIKKGNLTDLDSINGRTQVFTLVNSKVV